MGYIHNRNFQKFEGLETLQETKLTHLANGVTDQSVYIDQDGVVYAGAIDGGGGGFVPVIISDAGATLTLDNIGSPMKTYVFTGSSDTIWTMPAIGDNIAQIIKIKNRGSANITLQAAGSDELYTNAAVTSITILQGNAVEFQDDMTYWIMM